MSESPLPPAIPRSLGPDLSGPLADILRELSGQYDSDAVRALLDQAVQLRHEGLGAAEILAFVRVAPNLLARFGRSVLPGVTVALVAAHARAGAASADRCAVALGVAADRLSIDEFRELLEVVHEIASTAPTVLADLVARLPALFSQASPASVVRWARFGAHGFGRDREARRRYFSGHSAESALILRLEGDGALFGDVERRLNYVTRGLWGRDIAVRPKAMLARPGGVRPFLQDGDIWLPDALSAPPGDSAARLYQAAAAHAAAHVMYTREKFKVGQYKPIKIVVVSLLEDARVEWLASRALPGLLNLWRGFHRATPALGHTFEALAARLSRALVDPAYEDDNPWVRRGRADFAASMHRLSDPSTVIALASSLANDIGQMRLQFNFKTYTVQPEYRDDHSGLWDWSDAQELPPELSDDDEIVVQETATNPEEGESDRPELRDAPVEEPDPDREEEDSRHAVALDVVLRTVPYPEWDFAIGRERPAWCTVSERRPVPGDPAVIDRILHTHRDLRDRIERLIRSARIQRMVRHRKQAEGDRIDLEQAVRAAIDLRAARTPDPRIHMRTAREGRDLAVLVLLDLSKSTGDFPPGSDRPLIELEREAVTVLAAAMDQLGDRFAIHGFTSNARRDVTYLRFKDFDQPFGYEAKAALAGAQALLSTRMGAALRHAGAFLRGCPAEKKLLLIVTDGEPSDIDVRDPRYLLLDAKKAVGSLAREGIHTFCMSLDARADKYVARIFGAKNFLVVDHLNRLAEILPFMYLRLTHV